MGGPFDALEWGFGNSGGKELYAKESKCEFGMTNILYLGHLIRHDGV